MLMLQSLDGAVWPAPTILVEKSPLLAELVMAGTQPLTVKVLEDRAAYALLVLTCRRSWVFLPPDGTPLAKRVGGLRSPTHGDFFKHLGIAGVVHYDAYGQGNPVLLNPHAIEKVEF